MYNFLPWETKLQVLVKIKLLKYGPIILKETHLL